MGICNTVLAVGDSGGIAGSTGPQGEWNNNRMVEQVSRCDQAKVQLVGSRPWSPAQSGLTPSWDREQRVGGSDQIPAAPGRRWKGTANSHWLPGSGDDGNGDAVTMRGVHQARSHSPCYPPLECQGSHTEEAPASPLSGEQGPQKSVCEAGRGRARYPPSFCAAPLGGPEAAAAPWPVASATLTARVPMTQAEGDVQDPGAQVLPNFMHRVSNNILIPENAQKHNKTL